jgi:hypothetical protein
VRHKATKGRKCPKCKGTGRLTVPSTITCPRCDGLGRVDAVPEETEADYYARLGAIISSDPAQFFVRLNAAVLPEDVLKFRKECLDPILENLVYWWDCQEAKPKYVGMPPPHWRHPYGCFNPTDAGYATEYDHYLETGSRVGLQQVDTLFRELA